MVPMPVALCSQEAEAGGLFNPRSLGPHSLFVFKFYYLKNLFYVYECLTVCPSNQYLWRPEEDISSSGAGVIGGCERQWVLGTKQKSPPCRGDTALKL